MRKLFSIVFIALLLMNVMGYYGVFLGLSSRQDALMVQRLDVDNFAPEQIVTISFPLSVPYAIDDAEFKRVDGKLTHHGVVYRLLKQKFANDTVTIQCVRDTDAERINKAMTAYVETFGDAPTSHSSGKIVFTFIKDFLPESCEIAHASFAWQKDVVKNSVEKTFIESYFANIVHPPERA